MSKDNHKIFLPMKMSERIINWHGMGLLSYTYRKTPNKYIRPAKAYKEVILEYRRIINTKSKK